MATASNIDQEQILARMLEDVSDDLDKREGSVIHDALAPASIELNLAYLVIDQMIGEFFVDTATRPSLVLKAAERGITPKEATAAVWQVKVEPETLLLDSDDRFNCGDLNLYISKRVGAGLWELTCETAGTVGNTMIEDLLPITPISGLKSIEFTKIVEEGTDEEDTEDLRKRYLAYLQKPASSGNVNDYWNWAMSVDGVGAAKVFPLKHGNGTVEVCIANSEMKAAGDQLCNEVLDYIETERPVGATVTVVSAEEKTINVTAQVILNSGYSLADASSELTNALDAFYQESAFDATYVSYAKVGNILIDLNAISDYADLKINGSAANLTLDDGEIAVVGKVQLEVMTA